MLSIKVDERKPFDISLRNFKRACEKAGIKQELRDRQHYVKPTEKRKIAKRQAVKRARISQRRAFI
ncbi:30S ribosomal protein S21 [Francisella tularensis]|uniref:Small ribosomal subunit protein bS21A n=4 Tax=Francisella tularensis TaxID=263 RepID=RS211_FRATT|nr:30S ribosomal protein S21 [Francisella tularensis]Q14J59.1 RecName: Full=Small ribosomal subunit protein bS21A; AltName: Full=30S ribosomal protein S21 1 [Francisella tularensis subsp. tularensis FSC198]Q5NHQ7.1 RecName: Full=Small ribosomal subunit protein bS21A; AltName: Full=30S ribosomal protein S21 1 [Francisella tularensis subsp. tularensis SCHU S4]ACD30549.1 30S ribosomal protein S21 [Francisella tularensis subsp. mediasiatica FSC147]ADA78084.1 30S ribosomal protein S21 [Francisella t